MRRPPPALRPTPARLLGVFGLFTLLGSQLTACGARPPLDTEGIRRNADDADRELGYDTQRGPHRKASHLHRAEA